MPVRTAANQKPKPKKAVKISVQRKVTSRRKSKPGTGGTAELDKFRTTLLAERERLQVELQEIESRTARFDEAERGSDMSSYDDHPADLATETFEREKNLAIGESVESLLNQVNTALEKLERGTFGRCDVCARPIKKARLNAIPFATLCLECQDRLES